MMQNTSNLPLTLTEILSATGGRLLNGTLANVDANPSLYSEMVYDSRQASRNCIFLCIKGEKVDAHDLAADVIKAGAALVIGENEEKLKAHAASHPKTRFIVVSKSLDALQKLATFYRRKFSIPVIGLTGSSGKTTTKDLLSSILAKAGPALVTEGTLNNHWGVPQMVMRLREEHKVAAFEMGMSDWGEIAALSAICQPDIGYITTIGAAHLEKLKSLEGVLKAKRELFDWIAEHGNNRTLIFNIDNPHLEELHQEFLGRKEKNIRLVSISQTKTFCDVKLVKATPLNFDQHYGWRYEFATPWGAIKGDLPLPGKHNLQNALAAAILALSSGVATAQDVVEGLATPKISKMRSDLFKTTGGAVIYNDSYNANPTSVTALFEAARNIRTNATAGLSKTVAVVGDMLELGPDSVELHREMGRRAAQDGVDVLLATGQFARNWVEGFRQAKGTSPHGAALDFKSQDELLTALQDEMKTRPNETLVLIKGSRGAKMDLIVDKLK